MAADLLTTIRSELDARLGELRPLLSEYERLVAAVDALGIHTAYAATPEAAELELPTPLSSRGSTRSPTGRRPGRPRGSAAGAIKRAAARPDTDNGTVKATARSPRRGSGVAAVAPKRERAAKGAAKQAIIAALEHGSHTVGELSVVTAMSGPNINGNIRRLLKDGTIVKTSREGKTAYALVQSII